MEGGALLFALHLVGYFSRRNYIQNIWREILYPIYTRNMTNVGHLSPNLPSEFGGRAPAPAINKSLVQPSCKKMYKRFARAICFVRFDVFISGQYARTILISVFPQIKHQRQHLLLYIFPLPLARIPPIHTLLLTLQRCIRGVKIEYCFP